MKNKIQNSDSKNINTIYILLLLLLTILYMILIISTPKWKDINILFYEISDRYSPNIFIDTYSFGIYYHELTLHILFTNLISIPSICILWIKRYINSREKVVSGNRWKQFEFGLICIGLFLILELAFNLLLSIPMFDLNFDDVNWIYGGTSFDITSHYSFHILYLIINIFPIPLYIYGIHLFRKLRTEELLSFLKMRIIDKIIIGLILSIFFILFCWFFFFSRNIINDYPFSYPFYIIIEGYPKLEGFNWMYSYAMDETYPFSNFFIGVILPVIILKVISIYIQEFRLKDIVRKKNIIKIIEIIIFMSFFTVFFYILISLPPIIFGSVYDLTSLNFFISGFFYALIPFYIITIWKIIKKRKKIKDKFNKRIDVDKVLNRHQNIMQKMNENQEEKHEQNDFDLENKSDGEIK